MIGEVPSIKLDHKACGERDIHEGGVFGDGEGGRSGDEKEAKWELNRKGEKMTEEKEVIGYYTEDGNIYCVECINKDREIMDKIEQAITAEDAEGSLYFCDGCETEIK